MIRPFSSAIVALCVAAMLAAPSRSANAQLPIPSLSLMGGVAKWDSGTDTAPFGALRLQIPVVVLIAEGSLGIVRLKHEDGQRTYVIPEAQLQWELLPLLVKPYIGVGGGWVRAVAGPEPRPNPITFSGSAGVRVGVPVIGAGLRAEVRGRTMGKGINGYGTEWTVGLSW